MSLQLPEAPPAYSAANEGALRSALIAEDRSNVKKGDDIDSRQGRLFLYSPSGARWQIVVNDSGVLSAVSA